MKIRKAGMQEGFHAVLIFLVSCFPHSNLLRRAEIGTLRADTKNAFLRARRRFFEGDAGCFTTVERSSATTAEQCQQAETTEEGGGWLGDGCECNRCVARASCVVAIGREAASICRDKMLTKHSG